MGRVTIGKLLILLVLMDSEIHDRNSHHGSGNAGEGGSETVQRYLLELREKCSGLPEVMEAVDRYS